MARSHARLARSLSPRYLSTSSASAEEKAVDTKEESSDESDDKEEKEAPAEEEEEEEEPEDVSRNRTFAAVNLPVLPARCPTEVDQEEETRSELRARARGSDPTADSARARRSPPSLAPHLSHSLASRLPSSCVRASIES